MIYNHHPGIFGNMLVLLTHEFTEMIVHHEQVLFLKIVFSILTGNIASETWKNASFTRYENTPDFKGTRGMN